MVDIYTHPATGETLPTATTEWLDEILDAANDVAQAEDRLHGLVNQAHRDGGVTWELIGIALGGVTKQAVQKRFSKPAKGHLF